MDRPRPPRWVVRWVRLVNRAWYRVVYLGMQAMISVTKFSRQEWQARAYSRLTGATISLAMQEAAPALTAPSSTKMETPASQYKKLDTVRKRCSHKKEVQRAKGEVTLTSATTNYGNQHGRWTTCQLCGRRWRWNEEDEEWRIDDVDAPKADWRKPPKHLRQDRGRSSSQPSPACAAPRSSTRRPEHYAMSVESISSSTVSSESAEYVPSDVELPDYEGEY